MSSHSHFVRNSSCPECRASGRDRKGDNLGIYTDHEICWSCGYVKHYNPLERRRSGLDKAPIKTLYLPDDIVTTIPYEAHEWLKKYGLTQRELIDNNVVWSESKKLLIFLYVQDGLMKGWQGRYFGTSTEKPKWWSQGNLKEISVIMGKTWMETTSSVTLVEDIVSAIKVGRQQACIPIFGSYIDVSSIYNIYNKYKLKYVYVWLDDDKYKEAHRFSIKLNNLGIRTKVIHTSKDPKEFDTQQIKEIINDTSNRNRSRNS